MKKLKENEYKCAMCGNIYEKGWTDAEALVESENVFGKISTDELEVVCDDCWEKNRPN
jgi:DNA-directed RNA polymerase subunit RPC12/RpoP